VRPPPTRSPPAARSLEEELGDLLVRRETAERQLREDLLAVERDLERALVALDELGVDLVVGQRGLQLGDQTGRLGQVVSGHAVLDADLHAFALERWKGRRS
jgi:hypothetical protein